MEIAARCTHDAHTSRIDNAAATDSIREISRRKEGGRSVVVIMHRLKRGRIEFSRADFFGKSSLEKTQLRRSREETGKEKEEIGIAKNFRRISKKKKKKFYTHTYIYFWIYVDRFHEGRREKVKNKGGEEGGSIQLTYSSRIRV